MSGSVDSRNDGVPMSAPGNPVDEGADRRDRDGDPVVRLKGEAVAWHHACAGHEEAARGKRVVAEQESGELRERTLDLAYPRGTRENGQGAPAYLDRDLRLGTRGLIGDEDARPD